MWLSSYTNLYAINALKLLVVSEAAAVAKVSNPKCDISERPAGTWKLDAKRALSLFPTQTSILHIVQGHAWVTQSVGVLGRDEHYGDHFLQSGQKLEVHAGQHVVFESMDTQPVYFNFHAGDSSILINQKTAM